VASGLRSEFSVGPGTILRIAAGAFHSTRNVGDEPLELIEVEAPRNKFDLLRLRDDYSRAGASYESQALAAPEFPMRPVSYLRNTRMRERTPDGRFRFELRTGMDIYYRRRSSDIFYVPLCMSGVIYSELNILTGGHGQAADSEKIYLCIARGE
jgi:hypothetical protein